MNLQGRKVLVTGAAGFIGSHLCERLISLGADVRAFIRYTSRGDNGNLRWLPKEMMREIEPVYGDLRQLDTVRRAAHGVSVIFNLAAHISIPYSYLHHQEVIENNIGTTMNVLIAARDQEVERLVQTSTSEVFGTARYVPIDEKHPRQPQSPYAASKIATDALALSFYHSFGLPVAIIRPFNTFGPRQSDRAIIPSLISQALSQNELRFGNTTPTRDFTFVLDLVEAFTRVAEEDGAVGRDINIGTGKEISIAELIKLVVATAGSKLELVQEQERLRPAGSEVERLMADASLAREVLAWTPRTTLAEGLAITTEWIRGHREQYSPERYKI